MKYWFYIGWYRFLIFSVEISLASKPSTQFPRTHYSSIPAFHHSNCGMLSDNVG